MLNKRGEGEFTLYLMIGFMLVLAYSAVAFSDDANPKNLSLNAGLAGDTLINFESQAEEQRILLQHCLMTSDQFATNSFFDFNQCVTNKEILVSPDCPLNIKEPYLKELNTFSSSCYIDQVTASSDDEFIYLSINPKKDFVGNQFSVTYDSRVQAKRVPLLSEFQIKSILQDLNQRKDCLASDPDCLQPHVMDGDDLIVSLEMNPSYFPDDQGKLIEERTEFTIRVQDFLVTPLFK